MITLYSTGCPKCKVVKSKLEALNINYRLVEDIDEINVYADSYDIHEAPFMVVDGNIMLFKDILRFLKEKEA